MNLFVLLILWFAAVQAVLTLFQFLLRKRDVKPAVRALLIALKLLAAIAFAALSMAGPKQLRIVQPLMMAAYVALLADAAADLCFSVFCLLRKCKYRFLPEKGISLVFGAAFLVFGILNMQTVTPVTHTYTSEKLMDRHTIVFVADMHVGSAQPFSVTEKTVEAIKQEQPNVVVLGGDNTDEYTTKEEMQAFYALFADFDCPVYSIHGNHDCRLREDQADNWQYTEEDLQQAMTENGVSLLCDSYAQIGSDVLILGREDFSAGENRLNASVFVNPLPNAYLVVVDHQPDGAQDNLAIGMQLQLSGHTHAGQLFPLRWLYALIGGKVYGDYAIGDAILNVSAGACGWRLPLRTEAGCHYEVITLLPAASN